MQIIIIVIKHARRLAYCIMPWHSSKQKKKKKQIQEVESLLNSSNEWAKEGLAMTESKAPGSLPGLARCTVPWKSSVCASHEDQGLLTCIPLSLQRPAYYQGRHSLWVWECLFGCP